MLNAETFSKYICPCPCGSGKVVKQTTIPDTPWGKTFIAYGIECANCSGRFQAREGTVINIEDERRRTAAFGRKLEAEEAVVSLMAPEIESYFSSGRFSSKISEHREMQRLNLNPRNLVIYRKERANHKQFKDLCYPARNRSWLMKLAVPAGKGEALRRSLEDFDVQSKCYEDITVEAFKFTV